MKDNGWIKLHRKSTDSRVFQNEGLWKVWTWCLMKVNHSPQWVYLKTGRGSTEVKCERGQFVFGRHSAAKELNMNATTVWKRMQKLKNMQNIDIESDRQYSLITIMNMGIYQPNDKESDIKSDRQVTGKEQASDTNKNEKNEKKKVIKTFLSDSFEFRLAKLLLKEIKVNNPKAKEPNLQTWAKTFDLMIRRDKHKPKEIAKVIDWCQKDNFWFKNILSANKLREQYDQLILKMQDKPLSTKSGLESVQRPRSQF